MKLSNQVKVFALASVVALLAACSTPEETKNTQPKAVPVSVATVIDQRITEWDEFTGRVEAPETVDLSPRVSGYIDRVTFEEGSEVSAGDVLFVIDDKPFAAKVQQLQAQLATAVSQQALAEKEYQRAQSLLDRNAVSQEIRDDRLAALEQANAQIDSFSAELELAELDLGYTKVTAPISGRVSRALITKGNFVTAGQSVLTSLVSTDNAYVYFDADEQTYLKYIQMDKEGSRPSSRKSPNPVYMGLASQQDYPITGYIDFVDNQINVATGTIRGRATFANDDGLLIPGMFARVKVVGSGSYNGILIDDKAIGTDLSNKYVLVVNEQNVVEYRQIELGEKLNGLRIVKNGLSAKDQLVVKGVQHVRPGMTVAPTSVAMADQTTLDTLIAQQRRIDSVRTSTQFIVAHN